MKAFKLGDNNISPSDLGVGRHSELPFSLEGGMGRLEGAEERLDLLEILEAPDARREKSVPEF